MGITMVVFMFSWGMLFANQLPSICMAAFFVRKSWLLISSVVALALAAKAPISYSRRIRTMPSYQAWGTSLREAGRAAYSAGVLHTRMLISAR